MNPNDRLKKFIFPAGLFLIAFLLRFFYVFELKGDVLSECLFLDLAYYNDWAERIISGSFMGGEVFEMAPLYAYFQAVILKFISIDLFIVLLIQITIGSLSCLLIFKIIEDLLESRIYALIGGLIAALYGPFIFFDGMLMKPFLAVFFILLTVFLLLKEGRRGILFPLLAGISLSLCVLVRENVILLMPVIPLWLIFLSPRGSRKRGVIKAAFFLLGIALIIFPLTLRNWYLTNEFVLITSEGGEVFYLGNNPEADGMYRTPDFIRVTPVYEHEDFRAKARELTGRDLTRKESSDFWMSEALKFIKENPGDFILLEFRKLLLFWNYYEAPDNKNYYFHKEHSTVLGAPLIHFGIIAPLGFLGLLLSIGRIRRFALIHTVFLVYLFSFLLFFNISRFRLPAVPFVIIFAVYALWWLVEKMKNGMWKRTIGPLISLPVLFFISNYNVIDKDPYSFMFEQPYFIYGKCYGEKGDTDRAGMFFNKAIEFDPGNVGATTGLGNVYYQSGKYQLAENAYRSVLTKNPTLDVALNGLGNTYLAVGKVDQAIFAYKKAISVTSDNPKYLTNLGFAFIRKAKHTQALEVFKLATKGDGDFAYAHYGLASAYEGLGLYRNAMTEWKRYIELSKQEKWINRAKVRLKKLRSVVKEAE